jgi:glycosyltransferase involved in cell wall biosynthesis
MEGRFNILYAGNFGPLQDLNTIVRAAALLRDQPHIQIVLVGTGPKESEVKALAAELGVGNVRFVKRRQYWEMPKIYGLADVSLIHLKDIRFLHATIPSKTQVSMICGIPILMAARGDAADLVESAGAGVTCPPENPEQMAAAMLHMSLLAKDQLKAMSVLARQYYLDNLSLAVGGEKINAVFEDTALRYGRNRRRRQLADAVAAARRGNTELPLK